MENEVIYAEVRIARLRSIRFDNALPLDRLIVFNTLTAATPFLPPHPSMLGKKTGIFLFDCGSEGTVCGCLGRTGKHDYIIRTFRHRSHDFPFIVIWIEVPREIRGDRSDSYL
jgi:hypothetical protein